MFADLSGYTSLSERSDPEDVRAMVDRCMHRLGDVVDKFGGSVNQIMGDGMLAVFGAPVAHEDDAERAVRAALEMHACAAEHVEDFGGLPLRIGLQTGEVMFAPVGPKGRREQTVVGDVVNTAARLQASAPRGGVLVGEETWRATHGSVRYEAVEPLSVKGKKEPVPAWLALETSVAPPERPVSAVPMVGRRRELDILRTTWSRVITDLRPHLVTVIGPAGIGKTRLCQEFRAEIESEGARVLRGRCLPYGESTGYGAFAQLVKSTAGIFETDAAPEARHKLAARAGEILPESEAAAVASHLAVLMGLGEAELVTERQVLFFSARHFVEALAAEEPTVFAFEDTHWAEPSLLDLVEFLAARVRDAPVMFLSSARPELFDDRPGWGGGLPAYTALRIEALPDGQAEELATHLLPESERTEAMLERMAEVAGGNPLFIEELASSLAEGTTDPTRALPTSVKAIVAARLDALQPNERRVLLDASVVGKTFWRGVLAHLGGESGLDDAIDALEARDFVRGERISRIEGDAEFSFRHMLIREVAYSTLSRATRRQRHAEVARFAEETAGDRSGELAPILGYHWREAGESERAVEYFLVAAEQAGRGWAKREAVLLYGQAIELLGPDDPRRRQARMRQAVAHQAAMHLNYGDAPQPSGG
jgi:predicted ATPase/class 3 adenylate cyclase